MLKYLARCAVFGFLLLVVNLGIILLSCISPFDEMIGELTNSSSFQDYWKAETTSSMEILHGNPNADKAILGDSVMVHFLSELREENPDWCIANGNASFLLIGQYAMLNEFLDTHPNATEVYLILRPLSFGEHLNGKYSYQFVIRPLVNKQYRKYLSKNTVSEIKKEFTSFALSRRFGEMFERSCLVRKLYLNRINDPYYSAERTLSVEAEEYLKMIFESCDKHHVELIVLACPMADTPENRQVEETLETAFQRAGILEKMPFYFDSLLYYPPELFGDGVHFTDPAAYRTEVFQHYQKVTGKMESLVF